MEIWKPAIEPTRGEQFIIKRCKGRRVFVFLRELRDRIFDEEIQGKLRKNLFDLRRYAALNNLNVVDQLRRAA